MTQIRTAFLFVGVILLQACSTPSPSQLDRPLAGVAKAAGWKAMYFPNDSNNSSLYWARLSKSSTGYEVTELSPFPLVRNDLSQEILLVDAKQKQVHPAFETRSKQNGVVREALCEKDEMQVARPYSVCNSVFVGMTAAENAGYLTGRAIGAVLTWGVGELGLVGRSYRKYFRDALESAIDGEALNTMLPAAMERRRQAQLDADRIATEKRLAQANADREANLGAQARKKADEERKKADEAISVKTLSKLPRGYKDVCDFSADVIATPRAPAEHDKLNCINSGPVASLSALRQAGFIVTNLIERNPGDPRSTRYNVEKNQ